MGLLWEHWLSEGQQKLIIESIDGGTEEKAKKLSQFLGAVHDLGKISPAFQTKEGWQSSNDLEYFLINQLETNGFENLKDLKLGNRNKSPHALVGQYLLENYGVNRGVASIIGGHHGRPVDNKKMLKEQPAYSANYFQIENNQDPIHQLWKQEQTTFFERALILSDFNSAKDVPLMSKTGQVILSGMLIMADWIASNEKYFPLIEIESTSQLDQLDRLKTGWESWYQNGPIELFNTVTDVEEIYTKRFAKKDTDLFKPNNVQQSLFELIDSTDDPGIFILEAPTGVGKTEAALIAGEQLMEKTGRSGIFFGLPTQATSNGIFPRIADWLSRFLASNDNQASFQLVHGKAALNDDYNRLKYGEIASNHSEETDAENINIDAEDNQSEESIRINQWFTGRKTSALDDFVVGTVDQFLLAALKQKHLALRHLGFSRKVVIIDEVHAYDTYMNQFLLEAIEWMGAYQVPLVILSATLPLDDREAMVSHYLKGKYGSQDAVSLPEGGMVIDDYPLITYSDGNKIRQYKDFGEAETTKKIEIKKISDDDLYSVTDDLMKREGVIAIVVNTVRRAQEIAQECSERYGEDKVSLLHSNFIATDRIKKEEQLLKEVGKGAERPKQKIIIGTQVIEQSLDIDFDVMISDLAPMDLMIQRMGRLHRHKITRPSQHSQPVFYVLGTDENFEFEDGSAFVYGNYILSRSQYFLPDEIQIPTDVSSLVQKVYVGDDLKLSADLEKKYQDFKNTDEKNRKEKKSKARKFRISSPELEASESKSLIGWLNNTHPNQTEEYGYAQVRDTEETIEVIAVQSSDIGYSLFGEEEDISEKIQDSQFSKRLAQETLKLPIILTKNYEIDKTIDELEAFNRHHLSNWQEQKWLKGSMGIIFDKDGDFILNNYKLHYEKKYGLSYERMEVSE